MDTIIASLQLLKSHLPSSCTGSNIKKLKSRFLEYQYVIRSQAAAMELLNTQYKKNFQFLKIKIDAVEDLHSAKVTRRYFNDALYCLNIEIDAMIVSIHGRKAILF